MCNAQKKHRPAWYGKFSLLVQLHLHTGDLRCHEMEDEPG